MRKHSRFLISFLFIVFSALPTFASNEDLLKEIVARAEATGSDSLVIIQNNKVVYSNLFGGKDLHRNVQSITKSVVGLAIGSLLQQGLIESLDVPMTLWFPAWRLDAEKSKITLRMIMNHTSGLPHGSVDFFDAEDVILQAQETPLIAKPGTKFQYSNVGVTLLQRVIAIASGQSVTNYVNAKVLAPAGITGAAWQTDRLGHERTSGGLMLRTSDLVKLGQYMLGHKAACEDLLLAKSAKRSDYGLLWWLKEEMYFAQGWGGQFLVINPKTNTIAIRTKDPKTVDSSKLDEQYYKDFVDLVSKWQ